MQVTKSVPAVERGLAVLEALDRSVHGMNIAQLSRKLGIPRSTAHSITLTLERCGYLTRDTSQRHCMLSAKAYLLGHEAMRPERMARAAYSSMRKLSIQTQMTSHLAMLEQNQATYIQKVQGPGMLHVDTYVGKRTNLHCTAVGKVLLSYAPERYRESILARGHYARYTRNTITLASALRTELQKVRAEGYALDNQEEELDIRCLAVPVFSSRGELIASLSIAGAAGQMRDEALPVLVKRLKMTTSLIVRDMEVSEVTDVV